MATYTISLSGGDYSTIEDAISNPATMENDVFRLLVGTYSPTGTIGRSEINNLTISGTNEDATQTIIDASNIGAGAAAISASHGWVLKNFTVRDATPGLLGAGAIALGIGASATNIIISGSNGEGFSHVHSAATIERCIITGCTGSGISSTVGAGADNAGITVRSCLIHTGGSFAAAGGIYLLGSGTVLHNTVANFTCGWGITLQGAGGRIEHNIVSKQAQIGNPGTRSGFYTLDPSIITAYNLSYGHSNEGASPEYKFAGGSGSGDQGQGDVPDQNLVYVDEGAHDFQLNALSPARIASTGSGETSHAGNPYRDLLNKRFVFHRASKGCYAVTDTTAPTWSRHPPTITADEQKEALVINWSAATDDIHDDNLEYHVRLIEDDGETLLATANVLAPTQTVTFSSLLLGSRYYLTIVPVDAAENSGSDFSLTASTSPDWLQVEGGDNSKTSIPNTEYVITSIALDRAQRNSKRKYDSVTTTVTTPLQLTRRGPLSLRRFGTPYSCSLGS